MAQLQALPFIERTSWFMNSAGNLNGPSKLKGVALLELAKPLGGITAGDSVRLIARDGYAMTMSGPQLLDSKFTTFDSTTGKEVPHDKLDVVVVYEENGKPVDEKSAGPLRVAIMGTEQQATEGHWWVKWLDRIEIVAQIKPWTLSLEGVITEKMDNGTFESGAAPGCHGVTWTDADGHRWQGIPLWLLVGRVDDSISHSKDVKAFNDDVAAKGYQVQLIAADGYTQTFTADQIKRNSEMIVAFKYDGQVLAEKNYPLKLVGPKLTTKQQVGAITTIKLILP
jgi:DMSO/TMAO reductase YedYZ molybdopterin-dependent catalytic subunit